MNTLLLSRLQFTFTMGYHILWPAFTIGLAWFIVFLGVAWLRTRNPVYRELQRFWIRVFALAFAMGVVTGVVISYQLGLNWSGYARATAEVLAPLFVLEVLTAFFLEAGFIGIMLFGRERVGEKVHFASTVIVAIGTLISACWIISANSWMQTPTAFTASADGGFVATSFWGVVLNPSMPYRLAHMVTASFVTGSFVVIGVSAFWLLRGREADRAAGRAALSLSMWLAVILVPAQIVIGDQQGLNTRQYQPMKIAAMEGRWDTARRVPLNLIAWPDQEHEANRFAVEIPLLGSLILTHSVDGEVRGTEGCQPGRSPAGPPGVPCFPGHGRMRHGHAPGRAVRAGAATARAALRNTLVLPRLHGLGPPGVHRDLGWVDRHRSRPPTLGRVRPDADGRRGLADRKRRGRGVARGGTGALQRAAARLLLVWRTDGHRGDRCADVDAAGRASVRRNGVGRHAAGLKGLT